MDDPPIDPPAPVDPDPPGNPHVSEVTSNSLTLDWKTPVNATSYNISISFAEDGPWSIPINTNTQPYTWNELTYSTSYYFQLSSLNEWGESPYVYTSGTTADPPSAPTGFSTTTITTSSITLVWDDQDADSYNLYRSTVDDPEIWDTIIPLENTILTYTFTDLPPNKYFNFKLTRILGTEESAPATADGTTLPTPKKNNYIFYVYNVTNGFKNSPNSPQRSNRRPVIRQIR